MGWVYGITITCFVASYAVSLALEASRLFFRARVRSVVMIGFAGAGLFAHACYIVAQVRNETGRGVIPLSSWYDFCLVAAWILAGAYFFLALRRPTNSIGIFLLPLVLGLIGVAVSVRDLGDYQPQTVLSVWRLIHGLALAIGTAAVTLGFATGTMYLVQAHRLKKKLLPRQGFSLPSLEWLQQFNRESLLISTGLLALGLLSGVVLNLSEPVHGSMGVEWTDPVVLSSGVLFLWLVACTLFEAFYKPARQGRKVAYLTLASFLFLIMALGFVLMGEHGSHSDSSLRTVSSDAAANLPRGVRP